MRRPEVSGTVTGDGVGAVRNSHFSPLQTPERLTGEKFMWKLFIVELWLSVWFMKNPNEDWRRWQLLKLRLEVSSFSAIAGSRIWFRAWPCGLLAPNLYVSGETHCSHSPHSATLDECLSFFFGTSPLHHSSPSYFQGNNPTYPTASPPWSLLKGRENRSILWALLGWARGHERCQVMIGCANMLVSLVSSHAPGSETARGMQ